MYNTSINRPNIIKSNNKKSTMKKLFNILLIFFQAYDLNELVNALLLFMDNYNISSTLKLLILKVQEMHSEGWINERNNF